MSTRIFVLEPQAESWRSAIYGDTPIHYGRVVELPSGISHDLPGDLRDAANSKSALSGKRVREFLQGSFYNVGDEDIWVVWEGRAIYLPGKPKALDKHFDKHPSAINPYCPSCGKSIRTGQRHRCPGRPRKK